MQLTRLFPIAALGLLVACGSNAGEPTPTEQVGSAQGAWHNGPPQCPPENKPKIRRVLLLSVDGLHEVDLAKYIAANPGSTFAALASGGVEYTDAHTTTPSDSFPGMIAQVTGATPKTSGVYYDDSYDRTLFPPGGDCPGDPGTEVVLDESIEFDDTQLFSPINPNNLPHARFFGKCKPVFPHDFIRTNTIFEIVRAAGGYTAWSDKHPAYDILNGPSGLGIIDLYTPEINSLVINGGTANGVDLVGTLMHCNATNSLPTVTDYTTCMPSVMAYDDVKVQAILNQIDGMTSDGSGPAPVPTLFGMNFQQVSVGQKLPIGGYTDAAGTPSTQLQGALDHVDASLGRMVAELKTKGIYDSTLIIVSAKHGQSPIDLHKLHMEPGGNGTDDVTDPLPSINSVDPNVDQVFSTFVNPNSGNRYAIEGHLQTDDVGIVWLQDQSRANIAGVAAALQADAGPIHADTLPPGTIFTMNITSGADLAAIYGDPTSFDPLAAARAPNAFIQPNWGVIYSSSHKKLAEHGGGSLDDTNVALVVSNPSLSAAVISTHVDTRQIAPTILRALGLPEWLLWGVLREGTKSLPGTSL
jgi:hypothetical protein